jgi:ABC-type uncharacterized transport system fused permease/ATPase subunit
MLDDALSALDEDQRRSLLAIFEHELVDTAVAHHGFYHRTIALPAY